jgi:hypothetical protein
MAAALEAYGLLKVSGKAQGLTGLRQGLGERFKVRRAAAANDDTSDGSSGEVA